MAETRQPASPSPEVIRYFREKKLKPSFSWKDVWGEEHAHAFTVAKSTGFDILDDVRQAVDDALAKGETFATFQAKLEPALRAKGWWGRKVVIDPKTGERVVTRLGSPRRLKIIYEANTRAARAAGLWERAQRSKGSSPYFLYQLGPSEQHRPHHEDKRGLILPVDDPFWDAWFPPNGWGCKCWLRQIGGPEAKSLGGVSQRPEVPMRDYFNGRKNTTEQIPVGIDPGWHTSPGKGRAKGMVERISDRLSVEGEDNARAVVAEMWSNGTAETYASLTPRLAIPLAVSTRLAERLGARNALITVSSVTFVQKKKQRQKEGSDLSAADYAAVAALLETGEVFDEAREAALSIVGLAGGRLLKAVIRRSLQGYLYLKTLHPTRDDEVKRLRRKHGKK